MSRGHLAGHVLKASAGQRHLLTPGLFVPGRSSTRAKLYLRGDLYDLEVLGPIQGTGTGRYTKHLDGSTVSASHDRLRPLASVGASGSGVLHPHDPAQSSDGSAFPPY
ncbi:hypothetical protein NGM37_21025, partial [Streptomyces sp. TRM76130]|nr:hypothetical protein [Streptomyces sp. TRM76130]